MDRIKKIYVINLEKRKDRWNEISNEFRRLEIPSEKIERIVAFEDNFGQFGCSVSHCLTLQKIKNEKGYFVVLEDDFNFKAQSQREFIEQLNTIFDFFPDGFDMFFLAKNIRISEPVGEKNGLNFVKVFNSVTSSGYIINSEYADKLRKHTISNLGNLRVTRDVHKYSFDATWESLQKEDRWYTCLENLGHQRPGYSDIEKSFVNYSV